MNAIETTPPIATAVGTPWRRVHGRRRMTDRLMKLACVAATAAGVFALGWILLMVVVEGVRGLSLALFTEPTPGPGSEGGGLANAILGSLILTVLGIGIATPIGV